MQGFLENSLLEDSESLLDTGYHFEVQGDLIFIRSIEMYLKYHEAIGTGGGGSEAPAA
jgi:hypothetical protein